MKKGILFALTLLFFAPCFGISDFIEGDELFVWAESGLNLREKPDSKSEVFATIPFGDEVIVQESKFGGHFYDDERSEKIIDKRATSHKRSTAKGKKVAVELRGEWVRVSYKGKEGYVFDGYLSRFSPPAKKENSYLMPYFLEQSESHSYLRKAAQTDPRQVEKIVCSNGVFISHRMQEGGGLVQINIPEFSVEEAYLIAMHIVHSFSVSQKADGSLIIGLEMGEYRIAGFRNSVIIVGEWGC